MSNLEEHIKASATKRFLDHVINDIGDDSQLKKILVASKQPEAVIAQALSRIRGGTLRQYTNKWGKWKEWRDMVGIPLIASEPSTITDVLIDVRSDIAEGRTIQKEMSLKPMLNSLNFYARTAECKAFGTAMQSRTVQHFSTDTGGHSDRTEASPMTFAQVVGIERWVLHESCPHHITLLAGFILTCIHSSLRFGDAQRCKPQSISLVDNSIRGICWRTKVSDKGQPWGCWSTGFCGPWGHKWTTAMKNVAAEAPEEMDYLLPDSLLTTGKPQVLYRPMNYTRFIGGLRWMTLNLPDKDIRSGNHEVRGITAHIMKCTMLSWAHQLNIPEELRSFQGHHKPASTRQSVVTYSRDDVYGGLRLQLIIRQGAAAAFRPLTPQARGATAVNRENHTSLMDPCSPRQNGRWLPWHLPRGQTVTVDQLSRIAA